LVDEEVKRSQFSGVENQQRSPFSRDRARVLHSYAFRRLADKTQVVTPGQDDFPRTRLTHSLEVAQIAREIGAAIGCDPDITDAAGLAHDLGHPPFGHNGEAALDAAAAGIGGFEGNAQTLRIVTRLEAKVLDGGGASAGLNLTRACLDALSKYPWPRGENASKFGVYPDDLAAFDWMRDGPAAGSRLRCVEAQVMDWADDVAYSVHDLEDGVHSGHIVLADLNDRVLRDLCEDAALHYTSRPAEELEPALQKLLRLPALRDLAGYDGSRGAQVTAKRATSELTGRFSTAAIVATREKHGTDPLTRYDGDLVVPDEVLDECSLLKAIALRFVMNRSGVEQVLARQRVILTELFEAISEAGQVALSPLLRHDWRIAPDEAARRRVVIDQVAQLTDSAALAWHSRLCG
jgi:dGTPase